MPSPFESYLKQIRETPIAEQTEHTSRAALEDLLRRFASAGAPHDTSVQHEPKRERDKGAPDFKIKRRGMILGYVEVKEIGANLDKVLKSDQIKRYRELSDNILLTDYLQWIWIDRERVKGREILAYATDLEGRTIHLRPDRAEAVDKLISAFFSEPPQGIGRAQQLALALAARARLLRDFLTVELARQQVEHREGRLFALYEVFRTQVFHELTTQEFADAFAQMLAYGLFLARLNAGASETVTLDNVRAHIPGSFRLIRELVRFIEEMNEREYDDARWIVDEVLSIVNGLDLMAIHEDLSFRQRKAISRKVRAGDEEEHRLFEKDPFIYFYEDFLRAYDPAMRKSRGVYYTPPPIVNFIIRAVDDILKGTFGIRDGLADHKRVTVLDFACGTGTFLLEVFERIFDNIGGPDSGRAVPIVREHILKNLFGFEYLIAPYTIAHLKLSQYLKDKGHALHDDERLQVFLTNTLEPIEPQKNLMLPAIAAEVEAAQKVKDREILVITGNPPYSGHSKNKGAWIREKIDGYKYTIERRPDLTGANGLGPEEEVPLGERNPKWLNDDYVKFIRFAQLKMDAVEEGVVGIITNHSWLDNPTFRGMRQSLMRTFNQIYVLDLHGNAKKKEAAPGGGKDENVFDIEQGVAISVFVRRPGIESGVWRGDLWGKRLEKYRTVAEGTLQRDVKHFLAPSQPNYLFLQQDRSSAATYEKYYPVNKIFNDSSVGIVTGRDDLSVGFTKEWIVRRIEQFARQDTETSRREFGLGKDSTDWSVEGAHGDIIASGPNQGNFRELCYRPFDTRYTYYTGNSNGVHVRPRSAISRYMLTRNVALLFSRVTKDAPSALVTTSLVAHKSSTRYDITYFAPLLRGEAENLHTAFRDFLDARYSHHYLPEEVLGCIYAVLYAPTYRSRYAEFLRVDFPRIPFPKSRDNFDALAVIGSALIQVHLLRQTPKGGLADFRGKGDRIVEAMRYSPAEQAVFINKSQYFAPVPQPVWDFQIGGYQVLDKYLKSRKGRELSLDEITHVGAVADALAFTIEQMAKIDQAYLAAFPDRG